MSLLLGSISLFVVVHIFGLRRAILLQDQLLQKRASGSHVSDDDWAEP